MKFIVSLNLFNLKWMLHGRWIELDLLDMEAPKLKDIQYK